MYKKRLENVQKLLPKWGVFALLVQDPVDLYYLTGQNMSFGRLIIEADSATLYTDARYYDALVNQVPVAVVLYEQNLFFTKISEKPSLGIDAQKTVYADYCRLDKISPKIIAVQEPLTQLRCVKDPSEITLIQKACAWTNKGYAQIKKKAQIGISERALAREFTHFLSLQDMEPSFSPNVSFGANAAYPHHHPNDSLLEENSPVLVDIGARCKGYCADMTRVFFPGKPCKDTLHIYDLVQKAYHKAASLCKQGVLASTLDSAARQELAKSGMDTFFTHSLGHGVGLDIHEYPCIGKKGNKKDAVLQAGMVITIEPGIYLAGKVGARYENTLLVTKHGHENLFAS